MRKEFDISKFSSKFVWMPQQYTMKTKETRLYDW